MCKQAKVKINQSELTVDLRFYLLEVLLTQQAVDYVVSVRLTSSTW